MDLQLVCLCTLTFLIFCNYSIPLTFYPLVASPRMISQSTIGIVYASYSVGGAVSSLCIGKLMSYFGKVKTCGYAILHLAIANVLFGLTYYCADNLWFVILSIAFRTYTGICTGVIATYVFSQVPQLYPDTISQKMMILELIFTLGLSMGAIIGKTFYELMGYFHSFIAIAIGNLMIGVISVYYMSYNIEQQANKQVSEQDIESDNKIICIGNQSQKDNDIVVAQQSEKKESGSQIEQNSNNNDGNNRSVNMSALQIHQRSFASMSDLLDYGPFFKNSQFMITNFNILWIVVMNTSLFSFSSQELRQLQAYSYSDMVFIAFSIFYCLGMLAMNIWYPQTLDFRWAIFLGFILQYSGYFYISQLSDSQGAQDMLIGACIIGVGTAVCFIFTANQLIVIGESIYPSADCEKLSDMCSGFYNTSNMCGELFGSFLSGFLYQYFGFKNLCMIVSIVGMIISVLYFYLAQVYSLMTNSNDQYKDIEVEEASHSEFRTGEAKIGDRLEQVKTDIDQDVTQRPLR